MGNLGEALKQAGISAALTELRVALSKFINQGGTTAQIRAEADAIDRMSGMGLAHRVSDDQRAFAQTRQQVEGDEAISGVSQGHGRYASTPSSNHDERGQETDVHADRSFVAPSHRVHDRGGEGHCSSAVGHQPSALPVREPITSVTKRGLSSILLVQPTIEKGLLYTKKRSDGVLWIKTCWHELDGLDRDGAISRGIKQRANPPKNRFAELGEILSNKQFEEICDAAEKQNDHNV